VEWIKLYYFFLFFFLVPVGPSIVAHWIEDEKTAMRSDVLAKPSEYCILSMTLTGYSHEYYHIYCFVCVESGMIWFIRMYLFVCFCLFFPLGTNNWKIHYLVMLQHYYAIR